MATEYTNLNAARKYRLPHATPKSTRLSRNKIRYHSVYSTYWRQKNFDTVGIVGEEKPRGLCWMMWAIAKIDSQWDGGHVDGNKRESGWKGTWYESLPLGLKKLVMSSSGSFIHCRICHGLVTIRRGERCSFRIGTGSVSKCDANCESECCN